jgi:hypothetical protein
MEIDKKEMEDLIINPLNNIVMLAIDTGKYDKISNEVNKIIHVLEQHKIIDPRIKNR